MKRLLIPFVLTLAPALLVTSKSQAADHYDMYEGDFVKSDNYRHHDIVDVFTFPTADKKLVMIMNTYNRANKLSVFDDQLTYSFRVRTGPIAEKGNEYRFSCKFSNGEDEGQSAKCDAYTIKGDTTRTATSKWSTRVLFNAITPASDKQPLRVFAGRRADAFFGDAAGLGKMLETRRLPDSFRMDKTNVGSRNLTAIADDLCIVMEVDFRSIFNEESQVFRVAAETGRKIVKQGSK
jgi:hypothetical protein